MQNRRTQQVLLHSQQPNTQKKKPGQFYDFTGRTSFQFEKVPLGVGSHPRFWKEMKWTEMNFYCAQAVFVAAKSCLQKRKTLWPWFYIRTGVTLSRRRFLVGQTVRKLGICSESNHVVQRCDCGALCDEPGRVAVNPRRPGRFRRAQSKQQWCVTKMSLDSGIDSVLENSLRGKNFPRRMRGEPAGDAPVQRAARLCWRLGRGRRVLQPARSGENTLMLQFPWVSTANNASVNIVKIDLFGLFSAPWHAPGSEAVVFRSVWKSRCCVTTSRTASQRRTNRAACVSSTTGWVVFVVATEIKIYWTYRWTFHFCCSVLWDAMGDVWPRSASVISRSTARTSRMRCPMPAGRLAGPRYRAISKVQKALPTDECDRSVQTMFFVCLFVWRLSWENALLND